MSLIRYVVLVVFDPLVTRVVALTKAKGPSFLIGKLCFPGGKVEEGETVLAAASREMAEETGLAVPEYSWTTVSFSKGVGYELTVLTAVSANFSEARTCEDEIVCVLPIDHQRRQAVLRPEAHAPDFLETLANSLAATAGSGLRAA